MYKLSLVGVESRAQRIRGSAPIIDVAATHYSLFSLEFSAG